MKSENLFCIIMAATISLNACMSQSSGQKSFLLRDNWAIQSSKELREKGDIISTPSFQPEKWYPATVPSTVFGTLVENKVYPDPYFGTNIQKIPGYIARRSGGIPADSPFKPSWWYRTTFSLPTDFKSQNTWIKFHSINYKANIWLNGHLVADTMTVQGAYRLYNFNISQYAIPGKQNCLAVEIIPPKGNDLTITWVDWNPTPPDRGMGIWYDITVSSTGPVAVDNPKIVTKLNLPSIDKANLTISADVSNNTDKKVKGVLKGTIENISFSQELTLNPKEARQVTFDPAKFSQLVISEPRLWWPHTVGPQNLYDLNLSFEIKGKVSDSEKLRFGIREITSWMNDFDGKHTRVFRINGKDIVIKGGGYVEDMMLRPSEKRIDADIQYAKHMGLNALRMEAPRGPDYMFDRCDEEGILLIVGWCCCSSWEEWDKWTPDLEVIALKSWKDQILRLRNHPSIFDWLYGSDMHPSESVEKMYIKTLNEYDGTRPYQSSATGDSSSVSGNTGLFMGPYPKVYAYQTPGYWYGKPEFNTEAGPSGEQIPPVETMRLMMSETDLWPMSESWNIRLHKAFYSQARKALYSRYGEPKGVEEYSMKSQVLQYEATRGMFEAFAANKYRSSGIIYWMYNSAWPSMYWQLYDYFYAPNGSFYGTRKACENLHIQYSYNDNSVCVVNGNYKDFSGLKATAKLYNMNMSEIFSTEAPVEIKSDESRKVFSVERPIGASDITFLKLVLKDNEGKEISSNFYWLSSKGDENADFTALNKLPETELNFSVSSVKQENGKYSAVVDIENPSSSLAFFVNPKIIKNDSKELVLPVFWEDNYFSLLPKEKRSIKVEFAAENLGGATPILALDGWNIKHADKELK
jgi:exo-1,4-beta-D-glucosaminidase